VGHCRGGHPGHPGECAAILGGKTHRGAPGGAGLCFFRGPEKKQCGAGPCLFPAPGEGNPRDFGGWGNSKTKKKIKKKTAVWGLGNPGGQKKRNAKD